MSYTAVVFCVSALLVQAISGQCINYAARHHTGALDCGKAWPRIGKGDSMAIAGWNRGIDRDSGMVDTYGGSLAVTSSSALAPSGLRVESENAIDGAVSVAGKLPFLSAVALDGAVPSGGEAHAEYGCGNGQVRILETYGAGAGRGSGAAYGTADKLRLAGYKCGTDLSVRKAECGYGTLY